MGKTNFAQLTEAQKNALVMEWTYNVDDMDFEEWLQQLSEKEFDYIVCGM